mgnify:CR=1 FL=1
MKKLSLYVFLGLLWCNISFADQYWSNVKNGPTSEEAAKSKFFKNRKLLPLEGIWFLPGSGTVAITKSPTSDNKYLIYLISTPEPKWKKYNGTLEGTIIKTANRLEHPMFLKKWSDTIGEESTTQRYISVKGYYLFKIYKSHEDRKYELDAKDAGRLWPLNFKKYNEKFDVKKIDKNKTDTKFITQKEAIEKYLSGRELEPIEGVWIGGLRARNKVMVIHKEGEKFLCKAIFGFKKKDGICLFVQGSKREYYGNYLNKEVTLSVSRNLDDITIRSPFVVYDRLWPEPKSSGSSAKNIAKSSGSAFFVNTKGHLVTNYHVVEGCNDQSKIMYNDKEYSAKLLASDKKLDLALLKADLKNKGYLNFSYDPKKMQKIYAAGYPLGKFLSDDLKFTDGIISSLKGFEDNTNQIQISAAVNPGSSGGPVINQSGELVGIAVSGMDKGLTEGINFAIKSEAVKTFLTANKIKPSSSFYSRELKNDKLLTILEEATIYIFCN